MGFKEMIYNVEKKYGKNSKQYITMKLMYISYKYSNGRYTFEDVENIDGKVGTYVDLFKAFKVYPVLSLRVTKRIF